MKSSTSSDEMKKYIHKKIVGGAVITFVLVVAAFVIMLISDTKNFKDSALKEACKLHDSLTEYDKSVHIENDYFLRKAKGLILDYVDEGYMELRYAAIINADEKPVVTSKESIQITAREIKGGVIGAETDYWCEVPEVIEWVKGEGLDDWNDVGSVIENNKRYQIIEVKDIYITGKGTCIPVHMTRKIVTPHLQGGYELEEVSTEEVAFGDLAKKDPQFNTYIKAVPGDCSLRLYPREKGTSSDSTVFERISENFEFRKRVKLPGDVEYMGWFPTDVGSYSLMVYSYANVIGQNDVRYVLVILAVAVISVLWQSLLYVREYSRKKSYVEQDLFRRNLMNNMAHDLRTPLSAVSGYAQNMLDDVSPDKNDHYAMAIKENADYMEKIIDNVMTLAESESGKTIIERERTNTVELARESWKGYETLAASRNISAQFVDSCELNVDARLFKTVTDNLLTNAVKYASDGSQITVKGENGVFSVTNSIDTPPGKAPDELWKPFVKGDEVRSGRKGTGLGLSIVKNIVDMHGLKAGIVVEDNMFTVKIWE